MQATTVYLIYIHGFQGDQTSFQSFPTDLHNLLNKKDGVGFLPPHINLKSIIYPTYKSRKSIHIATADFLQWMYTLSPGLVILVAHSMGGLLAADAAFAAASERLQTRIIGILACDVPYLGMHPHVVLSGLASLLPKGRKTVEEKSVAKKSEEAIPIPGTSLPSRNEKEMNDEQVVNCAPELPDSTNENQTGKLNTAFSMTKTELMSTGLTMSLSQSLDQHRSGGCLVPPSLPPRPSSCPPNPDQIVSPAISPFPSPKELYPPPPTHPYVHLRSKSQPHRDVSTPPNESATLLPHALHLLHLDRITDSSTKSLFSNLSDRTKQQAVAYYDSIIETMEFGITMFDPKGLLMRYKTLIKWNGHLFVFWSVAIRHEKIKKQETQNTDIHRTKLPGRVESYHHFVVTPREKNKWERIVIHGAKDEVQAHIGLFRRDLNWEYDAFVKRAAYILSRWILEL